MTAAIAAGVLVAAGVYLILQRGLVRIAIGFVLLGHAANVVLVAAGGMALRDAPLLGDGADPAAMADPLPQAFVLTAIVITFGITVYLLALARAGGDDDPDDDVLDPDLPDEPAAPEEPPPGHPEQPSDWSDKPAGRPEGRSGAR